MFPEDVKVFRYFSYRNAVLIVFILRSSLAIEKQWVPDLEWQTASNWANNRVPEEDSHVVFPPETRHAVGIARSANLRVSQIDLPRSGSLVLPREGSLVLSESRASAAKSKWVREGNFFWADPDNWHGSSNAAPHLERVPCRMDNIILPDAERTFTVLLPIKQTQVKSIRMLNRRHPFTSWQWQDFQDNREFSRGRFTVKYSEYSCETCSCQDDPNGDYLEEICAIQRPRCGFTTCEYPLTVEGHCCRYCGGRVSLSNKAALPIIRIAINEALEGYTEKIAWHLRRTTDGSAEILLMEKGDYSGIDIQEAIVSVKKHLQDVGIEILGTETAGAALQDNRLMVALGPLFITPLILLAVLLIVFAYFGYTFGHILSTCTEAFSSIRDEIRVDKLQSEMQFSFARFDNISEGTVRIADSSSSREQAVQDDEEGRRSPVARGRFENPLYRSKRRQQEEKKILGIESSLSLVTLKDKIKDSTHEVELDTDQ